MSAKNAHSVNREKMVTRIMPSPVDPHLDLLGPLEKMVTRIMPSPWDPHLDLLGPIEKMVTRIMPSLWDPHFDLLGPLRLTRTQIWAMGKTAECGVRRIYYLHTFTKAPHHETLQQRRFGRKRGSDRRT